MTNDQDETRFVLIAGQTTEANNIDTTFLFDWSGNDDTWVQLGSLGIVSYYHACGATTLSDGTNIVVTNIGDVNFTPNTKILEEGTTVWNDGPPLTIGRK